MQQDWSLRRRSAQDLDAASCDLRGGVVLLLPLLIADASCVPGPRLSLCALLERPIGTVILRCFCPSEPLLSLSHLILHDSYCIALSRNQAIQL